MLWIFGAFQKIVCSNSKELCLKLLCNFFSFQWMCVARRSRGLIYKISISRMMPCAKMQFMVSSCDKSIIYVRIKLRSKPFSISCSWLQNVAKNQNWRHPQLLGPACGGLYYIAGMVVNTGLNDWGIYKIFRVCL